MFLLRAALERLCGLLGLRGHFADVKDPEGCSTPRRPSFRLLGSGDLPGALIELPTSKIREGLQHTQEAELPAPGLRRSAGCSGRAAGAEDPEGCSTPRRPSFRLLGSGDLPGALIELPTSKIREGLQHIQEGEVSAPGLWRPAWCSDQAADVEDQEGLQRIQGRRGARSRASEILLAL